MIIPAISVEISVDSIIAWITGVHLAVALPIILFVVVFVVVYFVFSGQPFTQQQRRKWYVLVRRPNALYHKLLVRGLDRLDQFWGQAAWSFNLFIFTYALAWAYPIITFGANTLIWGSFPSLGGQPLFTQTKFFLLSFPLAFAFVFPFALILIRKKTLTELILPKTKTLKNKRILLIALTFYVFVIGLLFISLDYLGIAEQHSQSDQIHMRAFLLFFSILPFVNAIMDFGSIGLTRYCLRRSLMAKQIWGKIGWTCADIAGAFVIFLLLGCAMVTFMHSLFDTTTINTLFSEIDNPATRGQYWWVFATLFSTFIPTLLHFALAVFAGIFSCLAMIPFGRIVGDYCTWFKDDKPTKMFKISASLLCSFCCVLCIGGAYAVLNIDRVVHSLVALFEGYNTLLPRWPAPPA